MNSKLPNIGTSIFSKMSKMALEFNAINLAQGFPNFSIDKRLIKIIQDVSNENFHQYAPMEGNIKLIEEIKKLTYNSYKRKVNNEEILVTAGATQAIFTVIQALINTDDKVLIIDPSYDCYSPAVKLSGGHALHLSMNNDFDIDWNSVENILDDNFKMIIINNPHNPSGKIFKQKDIDSLREIMNKFPKLLLLSDEVYEYIVFENKHLSINLYKELYDRSIIISSFGKTFHITGWKVGYLLAPKILMEEIKKVHQYLVFSVNSIAQESILKYLQIAEVNKLSTEYIEKRNFFKEELKNSNLILLPSEGTYFQCVNYENISKKSDVEYSVELVKNHGISTIPLSVFYKDGSKQKILRLCYAKDFNTLSKASEILNKL